MTDAMTRAMFGMYAIHVPINIVIQNRDPTSNGQLVAIVGQSHFHGDTHPLRFGSGCMHQLILGDAVIRPHIVVESDAFVGHGIGGLATLNPAEWIENPHKVLLDQMGDLNRRLGVRDESRH